MKQLQSILTFYKPYIVWSFGLNILFIPLGFSFIIIIKLLAIIFIYYIIKETKANQKLFFYKNLGISPIKLFISIYIIDLFISLPFLIIIKEFI